MVSTMIAGLSACDRRPCAGYCGDGTVCINDQCRIVEASEPEVETAEPEPDKNKKRRRRKRGGGGEAGAEEGAEGFVPVDDSHIPRFNPNADRTIDLDAGSERLSDAVIDRELAKLDPDFQRCITTAAKHSADELPHGTIRYELGIAGSGKVTGVNVKAPSGLKVFGIVPCVRKAVYDHRFPKFDGPTMSAKNSFSI
jgi:hypothetical protein